MRASRLRLRRLLCHCVAAAVGTWLVFPACAAVAAAAAALRMRDTAAAGLRAGDWL